MINLSTIKIFDKIYQLKYETNVNSSDFINSTFDNSVQNYIEFIKDNSTFFSNTNMLITKTYDGYGIVSGTYPLLNNNGINQYYEYKKKQFIENEEITLNYDFKDIAEKMNITNSVSLKLLLDYFIDSNLIVTKGDYARKNIIGSIDFDFSMLKVKNNSANSESTTENNGTTVNIGNQYIFTGEKQKIKNNDFSQDKKELERKSPLEIVLDKISKIIKK